MSIHDSLVLVDYVVIALYALLLLGIGFFASYRQRKSEDLFLGGRSLSWPNVGLSIFGTNIGPTFLIATCGAGYTTGTVTANFEWMAALFLFLLGIVFVPYYMNTRISTIPEFMLNRYGRRCYGFMSWYALLSTVVLWLGGTLFAGGALLAQIMHWPLLTSVLVLAVIATSFTMAGGLVAVVVTDSFQSILMIVGAGILSYIGFREVGGLDAVRDIQVSGVAPGLTWKLFHPAGAANPWYAFVLGYPVLGLWFWCTDQTIVQRVLGAKDLKQGQYGTLFAGFLKILPPFIFLLPGIFAAVLIPGIEDDKAVFAGMVTTYLPAGMVGLIVAVLIAAVISTLDSGLNSFSTIFTLDIYRKHIRPDANEHQLKQVGRLVTAFAGLLSVAMAMLLAQAKGTNLFNLFQSIIGFLAPPVAAVFLVGILWKRATGIAAFATLATGTAGCLVIGVLNIVGIGTWPHFLMLSFYMFVGVTLFMLVASLLTNHSDDEVPLDTLAATLRKGNGMHQAGWAAWGLLGVAMVALYLIFN